MAFEPIIVENGTTYDNAEFMNELQRRIKSAFDSSTGVVPEILWKNPTPTAEFNAQNIIINTENGYLRNISDYDEIIIYFSESAINTEVEPAIHMIRSLVGDGGNGLYSSIWGSLDFNTIQSSIGLCNYKRTFYTQYNILSFHNCNYMQNGDPTLSINNFNCIPLYVFGLKNGIKEQIENYITP